MSARTVDGQGRWRSDTVSFQISPEENELLDTAVHLSGLTKQEYIIRRLQDHEIMVQGNSRVYKALRLELAQVQEQLAQIRERGEPIDNDLLKTIQMIAQVMEGLKEEPQITPPAKVKGVRHEQAR